MPLQFRSCQFTLLATGLLLVLSLAEGSSADDVRRYFASAPEGSLISSWRETDEPVCQSLANGLTIQRQLRFFPQTAVLLIRSRLMNETAQPVDLDGAAAIDWTFPPPGGYEAVHFPPLAYRDDTWYGSTYWTGPDWTRVGKDWQHSGTQTSSIRRFTVPRDGQIEIRGRVYKADTNGGDGVRLEIRVGRETLWNAEIDAADSTGVEPALSLPVRSGDAIRFIVHRRGEIGFDTTHWDPVITYEDGTAFQASAGFSHQQGANGWSYEMESDEGANSAQQHPSVHGYRPELTLYSELLLPGRSLELGPAESLPAWIVADRPDASGLAVAIASDAAGQLRCSQQEDGDLRIQVLPLPGQGAAALAPGESRDLPDVIVTPYQGTWLHGIKQLQQLLTASTEIPVADPLRRIMHESAERVGLTTAEAPVEYDLITMVMQDWQQQDQVEDSVGSYQQAALRHMASAQKLLSSLSRQHVLPQQAAMMEKLQRLSERVAAADLSLSAARRLYLETRAAKRQIALSNPLLDFGPLLFSKRVPTSYSHLVMQYYGWRARPGGGIFVLERPGYSLSCRDILAGQLNGGNVLEPRLSYDATKIVFSYVQCRGDGASWSPEALDNNSDEGFYHLWSVDVDGSNLRQLTSGPYDDLMPCWLPDGGIAFSSTRRRGYARCFGGQFSQRWHVYTIHRANEDGSQIQLLSVHDTNEWFPTVSNTGHILYSRWDYIDRDAVTHQNLWAMRPDGTNPLAVWGNATSAPHCTFQPQPIPGSSKIIFTASAHHSITGGSLAIIDPTVSNNGEGAITRLTPEIPFPEAESMDIREYYASPWPLSEDFFLVSYSPTRLVWEPGANQPNALGIYLLDSAGNRELIYRDPDIGSTNACPLIPRPTPPVIPSMLPAGTDSTGEMVLTDVYQGLGDVARGSIKQLRVIQIFPKTTHVADSPRVGLAREENARAILGTVPVEPDGSAYFRVPALKPLLFQALDEQGMAYQTMRTITYAQPGERISCSGCHENRRSTPSNHSVMALQRSPDDLQPGPWGGRPFSFMEVVQPVLDQHCVSCHGPEKKEGNVDLQATPRDGFTQSYWALCGDADFWGMGTNPDTAASALVPRFGGRNQVQITPPGGQYSARGSRLMKLIDAGHYEVRLSDDDRQRLAMWIDCNAVFFGSYRPEDQARQLQGEPLEMPDIQ